VPRREFLGRAGIYNGDKSVTHAPQQFLARNRFETVSLAKITIENLLNLSNVALSDAAQYSQERYRFRVGEPVQDALAVPSRLDESHAPQLLQMLRGIGNGEAA